MKKLKTKRGAAKRFKVTAKGKVKASKSNRRHILTSKSTKRKRHYRSGLYLNKTDAKNVRRMLLS
jgi:large subunit ribosomal protein L35